MTVLKSTTEFLKTCPLIGQDAQNAELQALFADGSRGTVHLLPKGQKTVGRYLDGTVTVQNEMAVYVTGTGENGTDLEHENTFLEGLEDWLFSQNELKNFPLLDAPKKVQSISSASGAFYQTANDPQGICQVTITLIYTVRL